MRIHTNNLDAVLDAIHATTRKMHGVSPDITEHGSRSRKGAIELHLTGTSPYRPNRSHEEWEYAATYDEWGVVLGEIFETDPDARCVYYEDAEDFHWKTGGRFSAGTLPEDTHPRHKWEFVSPREFGCTTCTAVMRR